MSDRTQLEEWFRLYNQDLYHFLIYYTGSLDVEDLLQDVFIKAYTKMDQVQDPTKVKTWLLKIARNTAIDSARKLKNNQRMNEQLYFNYETHLVEHPPDQTLIERETLERLYKALFELKRGYREVLLLRLLEGYSVEETANILNWSTHKVSLTYHRALKKLQKTNPFQDEGGETNEPL